MKQVDHNIQAAEQENITGIPLVRAGLAVEGTGDHMTVPFRGKLVRLTLAAEVVAATHRQKLETAVPVSL